MAKLILPILLIAFCQCRLKVMSSNGERHEDECETPPTDILTTTTTNKPTTSPRICGRGSSAIKRKNGWWCVFGLVGGDSKVYKPKPYTHHDICALFNASLSSVETVEEWEWIRLVASRERYWITAIWLAVGLNATTNEYYFNDGFTANTTIDPQPINVVPGGPVAFFWNNDTATSGYSFSATAQSGGLGGKNGNISLPYVGMIYCGAPGLGWKY